MAESTEQRLLRKAAELIGHEELAVRLRVPTALLDAWGRGLGTMPDGKLLLADLLHMLATARKHRRSSSAQVQRLRRERRAPGAQLPACSYGTSSNSSAANQAGGIDHDCRKYETTSNWLDVVGSRLAKEAHHQSNPLRRGEAASPHTLHGNRCPELGKPPTI